MTRQIPWPRIFVEGVVIVASILLAFGIEARWQERGDRATERELLLAIESELVGAQQGFVVHIEDLAREIRTGTDVLRALSAAESRTITDDSLNALTRRMVPPNIYYPPRAALDDLTSSGGIVLVQSNPLRRAIASYQQTLARDLQTQELLLDIWLDHLAPYLYQHSTLTVSPELLDGEDPPDRPLSVDRNEYLGSRTYQNLVAAKVLRVRNVSATHRETLQALARIMELLEP